MQAADFADCSTLDEEFKLLKRKYFRRVLSSHPDKGGDVQVFRQVQSSFEVLRSLYEGRKVGSFADASHTGFGDAFRNAWGKATGAPTPSWEFYAEAAEVPVPTYRVELAKSGRSKCQKCVKKGAGVDPLIAKGEVRIGWMNKESGSYGGFVRLQCWRVPSKVWLGLPNPDTCDDPKKFAEALLSMNEVLLCGFNELLAEDAQSVVEFVMDRGNWARLVKRKAKAETETEAEADAEASAASSRSRAPKAAAAKTTKVTSREPKKPKVKRVKKEKKAAAAAATAGASSSSTAAASSSLVRRCRHRLPERSASSRTAG